MLKAAIILSLIITAAYTPELWAKDVYVCAGKSGNGSKEAPYGTLDQAIDMGAYAGDVIHVANGIYYGKGGSGKFVIAVNNLTLAGGYNENFTERNPWKYQAILMRGMEEGAATEAKKRQHDKKWGLSMDYIKASYNGNAIVLGEGDHAGTILDGFVIDGYTRQTYKPNGDLKTDIGPITTPLVIFNKPGCKVRNCVILNSGGPGVRIIASGQKENPETWSEISNCVITNTLMEAIDCRVGDLSPENPYGGYASIANNTIAFVWSWLGEGYGIIIGNQTNLAIENNIIAFATDYGMNNGFGNDRAKLVGNCFFNNRGGVYRFFDNKNKVTVVEDDPTKFVGTAAKKSYFLNTNSKDNYTADPKLKVDPDFFDKFSNQIKSEGGGKVVWDEINQWRSMLGLPLQGSKGTGNVNYAPIYEHEYMFLFSSTVKAGAKADPALLAVYSSQSTAPAAKEYVKIRYDQLAGYLGKDITVSLQVGNPESSGFYVPGVTKDSYAAFRTKDMQHFIYVKKGSEALSIIEENRKNGFPVLISGALVDIFNAIKMKNKYGLVVDVAAYDE
jgi:hypothetical protein